MTDDEFVQAFEGARLPAEQFTHAGHVRAAWWYLRRYPLGEALARFSVALRRYATALGAPEKYHETVTVAWVLVIADRLGGARDLPWDQFAAAHPDLLAKAPSPLERYYTAETLQSERARRQFVMPEGVLAPVAISR